MTLTAKTPDHSEIERRRQIILNIIKYWGTQEATGQAVALSGETGTVDQSAVSLWLKNASIPNERQRQLITASEIMVGRGERQTALTPDDFFYTPDEIEQRRGDATARRGDDAVVAHG